MISVKEVCEKIGLQTEIANQVLELDKSLPFDVMFEDMNQLFSRDTWNIGRQKMKEVLGDDPGGIKILTCMLRCALKTYDRYMNMKVEEDIFIATFQCFTRFIYEHYVSYGTYAFDRDWWTSRQLAMELVRIGELEYEMKTMDNERVISIHIPSDAVITQANLRNSYDMARRFFTQYFPEFAEVKMICHSWLLSPALIHVLPENSNIIRFQKSFIIESVNMEDTEFMEWIFKNPKLSLEELPENTSLQRNLKRYLINGGTVGDALGYLIEEPFMG